MQILINLINFRFIIISTLEIHEIKVNYYAMPNGAKNKILEKMHCDLCHIDSFWYIKCQGNLLHYFNYSKRHLFPTFCKFYREIFYLTY